MYLQDIKTPSDLHTSHSEYVFRLYSEYQCLLILYIITYICHSLNVSETVAPIYEFLRNLHSVLWACMCIHILKDSSMVTSLLHSRLVSVNLRVHMKNEYTYAHQDNHLNDFALYTHWNAYVLVSPNALC